MPHQSVQELFSRTAARFPDHLAVARGEARVTYRELDERSRGIARRLLDGGAAKGTPVAILADRAEEVAAAILGVLGAGCAFVPLDPGTPAERLRALLGQVEPAWVLAGAGLERLAAEVAGGARVAPLDGEPPADPGGERPAPEWGPDDLCYVYFTSGSTGTPKAIAGRLKGIDHFVRWEIATFGVGEGTRVSQLTSPAFDASLRDLFVPLCAGGTVCAPATRDAVLDPAALVEWIDRERIELLHCVPSLFRAIVQREPAPERFAALRHVLLAGEPLPPADVRRWMDIFGEQVELVNLYGPTETTMVKLFHRVVRADAGRRSIPVGRPMEGARAVVVDERDRPCPPGRVGEILIRTPYRTLGYYRQPELTARVFVPNPLSPRPDPDDLVYRTGDLGRVLEDGTLEVLGRRDHQIKLRGVRIEPGEVEHALRSHPAVRDVVVVDREDARGDRLLCAYVVLAGPVPDGALREHLAGRLPESMLPATFVPLERLPLTATGKTDRAALPWPPPAADADAFVAPRTATEEALARIWAETLGVERVGVHDGFFALGGYSLLAAQAVARVREELGVVLPLRALFDAPTVAGMAERVEAARAPASGPAEAPIPRAPRDGPLPLSFAQERVWTLQQLDPADTTHNMAGALRLSGALDPAALAEALAGVVRRHETLRTRFLATPADEAEQTVDPPAPVPLPLDDLSPLPAAEREDEARRRIAAAVLRPFDLERGPPFRVMLLRLGEREHVLAWTVHHIVSDGWSSGVLAREVSALYAAAVGAGAAPLPELPVQYADYAAWQRRRFPADALERQLAWWREHLAGGPPAPELPRDRPAPAVRTHAAAQEARVLPRALADRLAALGRAEDATPFVVLFAAFLALLHRYTGERDLVAATAVAGRGFRELEGLIGFFVNTLALRTDLSGDPTFRELVARVRGTAAAAFAHQEVPFQAVARALDGAGGDALTRVMFVHQHADAESGLGLPGLEVQPFPVASGGESFDLTVWATDTPLGIAVRAQYPTELYDAATVRRLLGHFATLLEGAAEDPDLHVSEFPLLTAAERAERAAVNRTEMPYPDTPLHEQVEAQAWRTPDAVAVEWRDEHLTYAELNRRANRLAHLLRARGVRPDGRVGVCLERSPEMVVAVLGILKAGAACVPLDPAYPRERLALMVADSGARPVVTTAALQGRAGGGADTLLLDREAAALAEMPAEDPVSGASADTLMYVVFTSGSTGRPKAVGVPHRVLANLLAWQHAQPGYAVGARTLQFSTLSFDASFQEIFSTWTTGGTLVLLPEEAHRDAARWVPLLSEARVERLFCPFVALRQLAERVEDGAPLPESLREVLPAGEQLQVTPALARLFERLPGRRVHNLYGPSETHVVTAHTLEGDPREWPALPPIGRPVWNTRVHVLDAALQPVPAGIAGELYLGGDNLARGYLGRPELTAERFVPDPFAPAPGERLYRTGDRARLRPDGALDFLGRADEQVKVRGFRVEPGEVETVLALHPAVRGVAVTALADAGAGRRLVAHVVAGAPTTATELRAFLEERVPPHMVPAAFVLLERFPLLPSGKLDRRALPDPDAARPALEQPYAAPRTPAEQALAGVWSRLLRVEPVGIHDPFLELGGDSILGIQVVSQARRAGLRITLQQLFDLRTVAALAEAAGPVEDAAPGAERARGGPGEEAMTLPLAPMQQGILFHSLLAPDEAAYVEHVHCTYAGPWDADAFRGAWERLVARHPALRTTFAWEATDEPAQVVHPRGELELEVHDWRGRGEAARRELAARVGAEDGRRYALDRLPLMHLSVFLLEDASFDFVWSFHNIVLDGWSASAVLREFREDFDAARAGTRAEPPAALPFARYLEWLVDRPLDAARAYWAGALAGLSASTSLRSVLPPPEDAAAPDAAYRRHGLTLSAEATDRLRRGARRHGLTVNDLFQGAWGLLLSRCTGEREVLFGAVTAGRSAGPEGVETAVGVLVNTLPVRLAVRPEAPLAEWLGELQRGQREARAHEHVPLHEIQRLAPAARFESILAFVNYPEDDAPAWLERRWSMQNVGYPLFVLARPGERLYLEVTFRAAEFAAPAVERLLAQLATTLEGMGEALDGDGAPPLARVPWLSPAERERLLVEWNRTDAALPEGGLAERFAAQATHTPDATAVVWGAERVAYRELERRARRVAGALRAEGAGPETVVALLAARGLEFWTAALGVLLAGAAYLPLDPAHPPRRHRQVLEGSRAPLALASAGLRPALDAAAAEMDPAARPRVRPLEETLAAPDAGGGFPAPSPAGLAYVIFTSGSTGAPKGAMVEHRGMLNHLHAKLRELGIGPGDRVAQTASQCFDISVWQFLAPLLAGAEVHVLPDEVAHDPAALARETEARGITVLETVPSLMRTLVDELRGPGGAPLPLRALRWMIPTGEALPPGLAREWLVAYPRVPLLNAYGPTECSDDVTHHPVHRPPAPGARGVPIGRQLPNVRLYVADAGLDPVPEGIPGELLVGGVCVGRGYAHEPVRTADVFVPDPFGPVPGARLYRTGDRVRLLPDGTLEFLGRIDFQVKVRGFRVEPGEIEAALAEHPAVRQAAVVARDTGRGELQLVAYVAALPDAAPTTAELRAHLAASLPEYMVPSAWVALDALPLGPTGKLDRRALPAPDADPAGPDAAYLPPEDGTERLLAEIWAALLRVERVGRADNFFERGGDSILAIQVASRARRQGLLLAPRDLFRHPTLAELAAAARPARRTEAEQGPVTGEVEPTPIQRWLLEDPRPDRHHFNNAVLLRAEEPLSPAALAGAAAALVRHHDALRLRFRQGPEGWRGWIDAPGAPVFAHLDLSAAGGTGEGAVRFAAAELQRSLDLEAGPLARVALLDLGARRPARVLLLVHHLAVDGVSWRILLEDLHAAYAQAAAGADPHLPPKTTSFRDWAARLHAHAASPEVRAEAAYWLEQSAPGGARLPADGPGGPDTVARERTARVALGEEETRALLEAAAGRDGARPDEVLLAALLEAVCGWTGEDSLRVELEGHGRVELWDEVDLTRTVGWLTAEYPVRLERPATGGPGATLRAVRDRLRAVPGEGIGWGLLRHLAPADPEVEELRRRPRPELVFNYLGRLDGAVPEASPFRPADEWTGPSRSPRAPRTHAVEVNAWVAGGRLHAAWTHGPAAHSAATVHRVADAFLDALRALVDGADREEPAPLAADELADFGWDGAELEEILAAVHRDLA